MNLLELLDYQFLGNPLQGWLIALAIAAVAFVVIVIVRFALCGQLGRLARKNNNNLWPVLLKAVRKTSWLFLILVSLYIGIMSIEMSADTRKLIHKFVIIALILQAGFWAIAILKVTIEQYRQEKLEKDPASVTTLNVINFIGRIVIWSVVLLLALDNLGVNITALVAGLGVGGIAVALALQTILGDLFASLSIVLDKPFVVGDFLIVGDLMGSVEYVGLKTTRLRSLSGEQLVFSNSDLLNSRIRNFGRMYERRVVFNLGVTYQTPRDKLKKIPVIIRSAIEKQDNTRFDRSHFKEYGDFSLNFESVYFVKGPDYNTYMDIQQAINFEIHEEFEKEGIEFAYPTQTLFVSQEASPAT